MEYLSIIMAIISLVASLVTLFAVWGNISNYIYNLIKYIVDSVKTSCINLQTIRMLTYVIGEMGEPNNMKK